MYEVYSDYTHTTSNGIPAVNLEFTDTARSIVKNFPGHPEEGLTANMEELHKLRAKFVRADGNAENPQDNPNVQILDRAIEHLAQRIDRN